MAKVFNGRIAIPGDKIEQYLEVLQQAEAARAPFREFLEQLNREFAEYLATKYVPKTVRKHTSIVDSFIHFICGYTDVEQLEDITKGMVNSHFRSWYKRKVIDSATSTVQWCRLARPPLTTCRQMKRLRHRQIDL